MVHSQLRPKIILMEAVQKLVSRKIALPSYNILANLIVAETNRYKHQLIKVVDAHLTPKGRLMLDALLEKESAPEVTEDADGQATEQRYRLTFLKKSYQSTKPVKIKSNSTRFSCLRKRRRASKPGR